MKKVVTVLMALALAICVLALHAAKGDEKVDTRDTRDSRVFELRTYHAAPGKMDALQARFRDHTVQLFDKHHMTLIGFWSPTDPQQAQQTLVYMLAFPSRDAALQSWKDFQA